MCAASAVAMSVISSVAFAQQATTIQGGGSTLAEFDYFEEFNTFNQSNPAAKFTNYDGDNLADFLYWPSGSGTGQSAFLANTLSADCLKVAPTDTGCGSGVGGINTVHYGASDATLSTSQISGWNSSSVGALAAGHLIQLPSMGVGISFPVVNSKVTQNGATAAHKAVVGGVVLTDNDLCGIFSGKISNWNATSAGSLTLGAKATVADGLIKVIYRSDGSGTSFLLLNHFAAVCTASNSNFTLPITPSTSFISVFGAAGAPIPAGQTTTNFLGESGSSGVANTLANINASGPITPPVITSAIGYLSPDFTTVDPNSNASLADGSKSKLVVAAVKNGSLPYIPTVADVTNALNHVKLGTTLTPPTTAAAGALPQNWVPLVQTTTLGYPIVGFTTFDFAQCYQNATVQASLLAYLKLHYSTNASYASIINNNGFVAIASSGAKAFAPLITGAILSNAKKWNDNIGNATACKGLAGR
jgi:ABC-type phosphate transport system substrate-binding protein